MTASRLAVAGVGINGLPFVDEGETGDTELLLARMAAARFSETGVLGDSGEDCYAKESSVLNGQMVTDKGW